MHQLENMNDIKDDNLTRYSAQMRLPEIGPEGQRKLLSSRVLIVGCGALGCTAAVYLAAAGIGKIGIADYDTIDITNLNRQVFFPLSSAGKKKVDVLAQTITDLNPDIKVIPFDLFIRESSLSEILPQFDFVVDAADNPDTTYLIDRLCTERGIPYVTAGISGWKAQIFTYKKGSIGFASLFPPPEDRAGVLPCSIAGIVGPLAGMVACIQAAEVIKGLLGIEKKSDDSILTVDLLSDTFNLFPIG